MQLGRELGRGTSGVVFEIDFNGPKAAKRVKSSVAYDKHASAAVERLKKRSRELQRLIQAGSVAQENFIKYFQDYITKRLNNI